MPEPPERRRNDQPEAVGTPLSVALVGCGKVARKHLQAICFHRSRYRLAALVDANPQAPQALLASIREKRRPDPPVFSTVAAMLAAVRPDVVAITTPSGTHVDLAEEALRCGAHVLVEKPLTLDAAAGRRLLLTARQVDRQVAVGHIYRFFPLLQELERDLRTGRFGRILHGSVAVRWGHGQDYYDQAAWRGTWAQDGGALMNQSVHALDLMFWLLGGKPIQAVGAIDRQRHAMEAEDLGMAAVRLDNGSWCQLEGTTNSDPRRPEASFTVFAERGEIRAGIIGGKPRIEVRRVPDGDPDDAPRRKATFLYTRAFIRRILRQDGWRGLGQLGNPHSGLYGDLADAIAEGRPPLADGTSGLQAVEAVLAVYAAALRGQRQAVPPVDFRLEEMQGIFSPAD